MGVRWEISKIWGRWGHAHLGWGVADPYKYAFPHLCYRAKFDRSTLCPRKKV